MTTQIVPIPRVPLSFRAATTADLPFVDALQKRHGRALGYFTTKQFEGYVALGAVLIAEADGVPVGYCISRDRYLKRDELGVVYQLCVAPGRERAYVGAALLREVFERSAYGCRLYCCWCAQDLDAANRFWEAMGFVPLAFRQGSDRKKRVHIFWQKKICDGDAETKWWYPFQTTGGAIRADRLVFPIPEGTHWRDVRAVELPVMEAPKVEGPKQKSVRVPKPAKPEGLGPMGGFRFESEVVAAKAVKRAKAKPGKTKIDARFLAAGRELRDRYLEHVNANASPAMIANGKYDLTRAALPAAIPPCSPALLPAA